MLDIAAGQSSTFFVARPPSTQAAKDEAKTLIEAPTPPPATAAAEPAATAASEPAAATTTIKPSYDISGFGFSFGPPAAADAAPVAPAAATSTEPAANEVSAKRRALGISRTHSEAWEELARFPPVLDATDNCRVCGGFEADEVKGDILECEKVRFVCRLVSLGACSRMPRLRLTRSWLDCAVRGGVPRGLPLAAYQGHPGRCACLVLLQSRHLASLTRDEDAGEWFCPECEAPVAEDVGGAESAGKKRKAEDGGASLLPSLLVLRWVLTVLARPMPACSCSRGREQKA